MDNKDPKQTDPAQQANPAAPANSESKPADVKPAATQPTTPPTATPPPPATAPTAEAKKDESSSAQSIPPATDGTPPSAPGANPQEAAKKRGFPVIAMIIGIVIILAAIGAAYYFTSMSKKPTAVQQTNIKIKASPTSIPVSLESSKSGSMKQNLILTTSPTTTTTTTPTTTATVLPTNSATANTSVTPTR